MSPAAVALAAVALLVPTPIGVGPRFQPPPAARGACAPGQLDGGGRVHVELFAAGRVVIVPAGIGVRGGRTRLGRIAAARCRGAVWTADPTGVVHFEGARTLGSLFSAWGRRLRPERLLSFRGRVRLYRNGVPARGDPRLVPLRDGDQLVLQVGPFVPPHRSYRFP
ncbi:MAG TPA: hypothetical protein VFU10_00480 [Gaiellaceae bacterium]|nr:hypothetical protein [Gaiellaceae bacterium]